MQTTLSTSQPTPEALVRRDRDTLYVSEEKTDLAQMVRVNQRAILSRSDRRSFSLYVSIPFCPTRCNYCSFVSQTVEKAKKLIEQYIPLLLSEIRYTAELAKELDQMRSALYYHRLREQAMIKQSNDMITGLSHDLRTPLTKLMLYSEIIQNDRCTDKKQLDKYLARIHEKGLQMKEISDHLLKYSLSQGMPEALIMQSTSFQSAFFDRLSELIDYLTEHGFAVECDIDWIETQIRYNDLYLNRILDNIASNINKYAEKKYPVIMSSVYTDHFIGISVRNFRSSGCDHTESNGIGIESSRTMMRQMNGRCTVKQTETAFEITLLFPKR